LHTNNIMYKNTSQKYVFYTFNKKHYKVPTFGRIMKVIDFGRSMYRFKDKLLCSDSFEEGGDAHGQYNTEPYLDTNKPRLEANMSFDLCRLGCSMYDFLFDSEKPPPAVMNSVQETVFRWCQDDYGKNILYKRTGEERYPNFKLYKMISRLVHKHIPEKQLAFPFFSQFEICNERNKNTINIDEIPKYYS